MFVDALDVDAVIAHLLVTEGFSSVEEVAFVPIGDLLVIEGFDEDMAEELRARARHYLEQRDAEFNKRRVELGVEDDLAGVEGVTPSIMVVLGENGIKSRDDLADLAADELQELFKTDVPTDDAANGIIMAARAHWFEDDETPEETDEAEASGGSGNPKEDAED
jgi:N utilization substance protein A